jgi:hypothetical protein
MSEPADAGRIWVALDALERSEAPLGAALGLARILRAELAALFVENVDLFRMAAFPRDFETRLFGPPRDPGGPDGLEGLEAALRAQASALQRQLGRAAGASGVPWSFHIARGRILQQALEVAGAGDCVVLPCAAIATSLAITRPGVPARPGPVAHPGAVARREAVAPLRLGGKALAAPRQLWALPGPGPRGRHVLEIAHRLLDDDGPGRLVLPDDPREAAELRDWLRQRGWQDEWREASLAGLQAARQRPGGAAAGILLLPRPADDAERARLEGSLRRAGWPIVMV